VNVTTRQKIAVVTGASRGIGLSVARSLEQAGAFVFRLARSLTEGERSTGVDIRCDLSREEDVRRAAEKIASHGNGIDILVSNAGTFVLKPAVEFSRDEFAQQLDVNLVGPFDLIREMLPLLAARAGHLVTIGSIADHNCFPGNASYSASKYGLRALHEVIAVEQAGKIRATLVSPGPTNTALWDPVDPDKRDDLPSRSEMLGPDDVAEAVMFAISRPPHANIDVIRLAPSGLNLTSADD